MVKKFSSFVSVVLGVCLASLLYWFLYNKPFLGVDDANIYMVYMKNFANGNGFVYNDGGEQVEGFTSLLWTLIGALSYKLFQSFHILFLLNLLAISSVLYRITQFINKSFNNSRYDFFRNGFLLATLVLIPGYWDWAFLSLLETGLWSALLCHAVLNILEFDYQSVRFRKKSIELSVILSVMILTRPESMLWVLVFVLVRFVQFKLNKIANKRAAVDVLLIAIFPAISFVLLIVWRLNYFGFMFPNTYYAKVSNDLLGNVIDGLLYFVKTSYGTPLFMISAIAIIIGLFILFDNSRRFDASMVRNAGYLSFLIAVCYSIPLITGGDHFMLGRFFQPLMPIIILHIVVIISFFKIDVSRLDYKLLLFGAALVILVVMPNRKFFDPLLNQGHLPIQHEFGIADEGRRRGDQLNRFYQDMETKPSIGVVVAGGIAYSYNGDVIDLLGLNSVAMAHATKIKSGIKGHSSFSSTTFYKLLPEMFYIYDVHTTWSGLTSVFTDPKYKDKLSYKALGGIIDQKELSDLYVQVAVTNLRTNQILHTFYLRESLAKLDPQVYHVTLL